jgi:hypothetical protein
VVLVNHTRISCSEHYLYNTTPTLPYSTAGKETSMADDQPRYTPDEFFDKYFDFLKDARVQRKLKQRGIRTGEHEELLFRFIAYVKNVEFIVVKRTAERRKVAEIQEENTTVPRMAGRG